MLFGHRYTRDTFCYTAAGCERRGEATRQYLPCIGLKSEYLSRKWGLSLSQADQCSHGSLVCQIAVHGTRVLTRYIYCSVYFAPTVISVLKCDFFFCQVQSVINKIVHELYNMPHFSKFNKKRFVSDSIFYFQHLRIS